MHMEVVLGTTLQISLNAISSPSGGQGPTKKKRKETRKQNGGGNARRSAGHGGGGRSRSTSTGRTQRQGGGFFRPNGFLDQAAEQQRADGRGAGRRDVPSLTTSPKRPVASDQSARRDGKKAVKSNRSTTWISTQNNDEPQLSIGPLGTIRRKKPSTTTKRSREMEAFSQSKSDADNRQGKVEDPIDMTSDDNDDEAAKGGSSRKRTPSPVPRSAGSDDEKYGISDALSSGSGRTDGVDWELKSDKSSDSEDFVQESQKNERSNGKRKENARTLNKKSYSEPIDMIEDDDEKPGTSQVSVLERMMGSSKKLFRGYGSGSKRAKDEQGDSGMNASIFSFPFICLCVPLLLSLIFEN